MRRLSQKGFTLIEILIAVTLLAIISILVWQSMFTTTSMKDRSERRDQEFRRASLALSRISQDLSMSVIFLSVDMMGVSASGEQMSKSVFIGKNEGDQDQIIFNSFSHIRYMKDTKESDLAEISYFLESDPDRSGSYLLKKREVSPPTATPDQPKNIGKNSKGQSGESVMTLLDGVKGLNFRYYNLAKAEFADEWDTTKADLVGKLPRAVEVTLTMLPTEDEEGGEEKKFVTEVIVESAPGPSDF